LFFKSHPSEDLLEEYVFGRLSEEQLAPLEEHLLVCSTCQRAVSEIDDLRRLLRLLPLCGDQTDVIESVFKLDEYEDTPPESEQVQISKLAREHKPNWSN
jgi:hypothetical protein